MCWSSAFHQHMGTTVAVANVCFTFSQGIIFTALNSKSIAFPENALNTKQIAQIACVSHYLWSGVLGSLEASSNKESQVSQAYVLSAVTLRLRHLCSHDQDLFRWSERLHGHVESLAVVPEAHLCAGRSCQLSPSDEVTQVIQHASKHFCIWGQSLIVIIFILRRPHTVFFKCRHNDSPAEWSFFHCVTQKPRILTSLKMRALWSEQWVLRDVMCLSEMQSESGRSSSHHRDSHWLLGHPSICHHRPTKPGKQENYQFPVKVTYDEESLYQCFLSVNSPKLIPKYFTCWTFQKAFV